ncbi:MAG TPA: CvpA family protein [Terriglobales bacterium]|nr:CvpA family protein [Terriglobales bacterium]
MIIDVLIVLVVVGAAWVGFQRGLVQPLLAELFALVTVLVILHNRSAFAATTDALFHTGAVLAVIVGLILAGLTGYLGARLGGSIHRMPVVRGVDGFLGVWVQALIGIAICYLLISGIIVSDRAFTALTAPTVNAAQLRTLENQLSSNLFTSTVLDGPDVQTFNARASRPGGVQLSDVPGLGPLQSISRDILEPQLAGSHLAPFVMSVGHRIPGLGPFGSRDLPRRR